MALPRSIRRNRGWIGLMLVVLLAGATVAIARQSKPEEATTTYTTSAAGKGTLSVTVSGTGNLEVADETEVWPESAGSIDSLEVAEGDSVKAGDTLFTLDAEDAEAATEKALASYRQSQSGVAQARVSLTRAQNSLDDLEERADLPTSTVSASEIDAAEAEVAAAKASLSSAKASQASALRSYNDAKDAEDALVVKAPVSGVVWQLNADEGDAVAASGSSSGGTGTGTTTAASTASSGSSSAPVVIAPKQPLAVTLSVNEVDLPSLKVGQRADVAFDALPDLALTGKVSEVSKEGTVDQGVVTFDVTLTLDVTNPKLKPGMSASATIVTAVARNVLLTPNAAVKSDDDGDYVQVLDSPQGQPRRVSVETGLSSATQTEIVSGISEGDLVVTATNDASDSESEQARPGGMMMMGGPR